MNSNKHQDKIIKNAAYKENYDTPKISVIVTCYKYAHYLEECINSVAHQTLKSVEVIIVNDCSPDDTYEVTIKMLDKHKEIPILLMNNEKNLGLSSSRNIAIELSRAPYFFILDADNSLKPTCLEKHLEVIEQEDIAFCYSYRKIFGDETEEVIFKDLPYDFELLKQRAYIDAMALVKKSAWKTVQGYRADQDGLIEDHEFWFRLGKAGFYGKLIPQHLTNYRKHKGSLWDIKSNFYLPYNNALLKQLHPEINSDILWPKKNS